jgi:predicted transcriptional regulator
MKLQACFQLKAKYIVKKYIVKQQNTSLQNEKQLFYVHTIEDCPLHNGEQLCTLLCSQTLGCK